MGSRRPPQETKWGARNRPKGSKILAEVETFMNLLIHDLNEKEWEKISADYEGWKVISPDENIHPCMGCFGCWTKTPGECVIKDGFDHMSDLIHNAGEVVIISKYTYGGFSSFVKNVLDRSLGYLLPYFRIVKGEMHHKPRYPEKKPVTFIFHGNNLSDDEKKAAEKYVTAVCVNLNGILKEIRFEDFELDNKQEPLKETRTINTIYETVAFNCSTRGNNSNSGRFLNVVEGSLNGEVTRVNLASYINKPDEAIEFLLSAQKIILAMPLYVDGISSAMLKLMVDAEKECAGNKEQMKNKKVYVIANMGFYESKQLSNLNYMVKSWCLKCGFEYCGAVLIGAGVMMGQVLPLKNAGPGKFVYEDLIKMADAINASENLPDIYTRVNKFPRIAYYFAGNSGFVKTAKSNGLTKKDTLKR